MSPPEISPLRVALLGADENTPELARAIASSNRFQLVAVSEVEPPQNAPFDAALFAGARRFEVWESLLDLQVIDAVIVARDADDDRRAEQLRKLIQAGVPVLASHPVADSMLVYYELDMIRRDTQCIVLPYLPNRFHPAAVLLAEMVAGRASSVGNVEQVVMQRTMPKATKQSVVEQFARDVDLLRTIAGDMTRLGAMAGAPGSAAYGSLGIQMSGPSGVAARWSVVPGSESQAQIAVVGADGQATVMIPPAGEPWTMATTVGVHSDTQMYDDWDPAAEALTRFALAIEGVPPTVDWVDAARGVELAETIERSLHKGRTIELYYEDYTEEGTFKGMMASVGCGLLLLAMVLLGVVAIAEQAGVPYTKYWPVALLGALGLFLMLQLLTLVFRKRDEESSKSDEPAGKADAAGR